MSIMPEDWPGWESRPCLGTDLVLWYGPPEAGDGPGGYREPADQRAWRERRAKQICMSCPVRVPCLEAELRLPIRDQWGVRGGMTARERRALLRARARGVSARVSSESA